MKISQQLLQHLLASSEPVSIADIATGTGLEHRVVSNNINALIKGKAGLIGRKGKGRTATFFINDRAATEEKLAAMATFDQPAARKKKTRKTTTKAKKKTRKTRRAKAAEEPESTFTFFLSDELEVQLVPADDKNCGVIVPTADVIRLRDFLNRLTPLLEAA